MNDTTITPEEMARLRGILSEHGNPQVEDRIILRLLNTAEQAKARAEKAEANVARLTAERDWLADKVGDAYGKPCDKDLTFTQGNCPMGHLWGDDCCIHTDKPTCWAAEAARRAVADSEGKK